MKDFHYRMVPLMQPLRLDAEVYPGDPTPSRKVFSKIQDGWEHYIHELGDHNFSPHCDAPNHQNPNMLGVGIETWGLDFWQNSCFMIDLSNSEGAQTIRGVKYLKEVKREHLVGFQDQLRGNTAVVIRTGYDRWLENNFPHNPEELPYLAEDAAKFLGEFENLRVVGIDSLTVDPVGKHTAHQALKNKMILESLVHCSDLPQGKEFYLVSIPVGVLGATGCPVACVGLIPD